MKLTKLITLIKKNEGGRYKSYIKYADDFVELTKEHGEEIIVDFQNGKKAPIGRRTEKRNEGQIILIIE